MRASSAHDLPHRTRQWRKHCTTTAVHRKGPRVGRGAGGGGGVWGEGVYSMPCFSAVRRLCTAASSSCKPPHTASVTHVTSHTRGSRACVGVLRARSCQRARDGGEPAKRSSACRPPRAAAAAPRALLGRCPAARRTRACLARSTGQGTKTQSQQVTHGRQSWQARHGTTCRNMVRQT